ncbi:MAG: TonB-dependent receptor [Bacteroidales bacterium]|nr:TonB-dependent receptor [Bacteroidales bacterium]
MKSAKAIILASTLSLILLQLNGQYSIQDDTLKIEEVIITPKQITSKQPGFKFYSIDSAEIKNYSLLSVTELLNETTPLYIKYYGSGGTATSSFRGTSAGHTQVNWNGININDPMLGQSDFSLIPAGMIDNLIISFGGASMDLGNGGIGGLINLENEPSWEKQTLIDLSPGTGNFGRYAGLIKFKTGNDHFQSVTKAYGNKSRNNFTYLINDELYEPVSNVRENNQSQQSGFMQELYFRKSRNVLSARFWYNTTERDLPGSTLYGYAGEKQSDKALRSLINYNFYNKKNEYFATAAWISTNLDYVSQLYSIESQNKVNKMILKAGLTRPLGEYTRLKIVMNEELNLVRSNNYLSDITRNNTSLTVSAEKTKGRRFGTVLLLRETLDDDTFLFPDFSAGLEYRILAEKEHFLKLNASRNSKIPSLNDLFWNPGGNPDLRNEYAYSCEVGYKIDQYISQSIKIGAGANWFNNYIRDMIQWHQGELSYWVADNISRVNTSGLESMLNISYASGGLMVKFNTAYSYVRALSKDTPTNGKQLTYVPKNKLNSSLQFDYKNIYSLWLTDFTGRRFTTADNSDFLEAYFLNNIVSGVKFSFEKGILDLCLRIDNLFNVSYETIAFYPQPGRSFFFTMSYRIKV